jgi:hypothetical protein
MSIVGHKTESIYRRYAIVDEAMQREAAVRLDAWMQQPKSPPPTGSVTAITESAKATGSERVQSAGSGAKGRRRGSARS